MAYCIPELLLKKRCVIQYYLTLQLIVIFSVKPKRIVTYQFCTLKKHVLLKSP